MRCLFLGVAACCPLAWFSLLIYLLVLRVIICFEDLLNVNFDLVQLCICKSGNPRTASCLSCHAGTWKNIFLDVPEA